MEYVKVDHINVCASGDSPHTTECIPMKMKPIVK